MSPSRVPSLLSIYLVATWMNPAGSLKMSAMWLGPHLFLLLRGPPIPPLCPVILAAALSKLTCPLVLLARKHQGNALRVGWPSELS